MPSDHKCMCERIFSKTEAKLENLRLVGTIKIEAEEDLRILLPLSSKCDCYPVNNRKVVVKPVVEENLVVEAPSSEEKTVVGTHKEVQVPVTKYNTMKVPAASSETKMVKVKLRERV